MKALYRGLCISLLTLPLFVVGCGDDGDGGGSDVLTSCNELCEVETQGAGCTDTATENCKQLCDLFVPSFSEECRPKAQTYFECAKAKAWTCSGDFATSTDEKCSAESDAYNASCLNSSR